MDRQGDLMETDNMKPGIFYGYIIVAAAFVIMALAFGINYSFGVFFKPLLTEFGWTRAVTAAAYSMVTIISGFLGIFTGKLTDRFGARAAGIACGFFMGLGCVLMSQVNAVWQLYLFYGLFIALGMSGSFVPYLSTVARWFVSRRGLMTGIVASGVGFGTLIVPPVATRLISSYGWRTSYIIIGIAVLVLIVLAAQFMKRDPQQIGQAPYGERKAKQSDIIPARRGFSFKEALHTGQYWIICIIYFCFGYFLHNIMVHVVPHAIELGIPAISAANILAIIGGMNLVGRIAVGGASDKVGVKLSLLTVFILATAVLLWLQVADELWMLYLFAVLFGFAYGGIMALQTLSLAELFGLKSLGVILGSVAFVYTCGGAVGPLIAGYIFDMTGSYYLAFLVCAAVAIAGLVLVLLLRPIRSSTGKI